MDSDPLEQAAQARAAQAALAVAAERPQPLLPPAIRDPLPLCVYTTVALLAWAFTPGLVVAAFGLAGLRAYAKAWRAGLRRSDCILGDVRVVMLYLGLATLAGLGWTALRAGAWLHRWL